MSGAKKGLKETKASGKKRLKKAEKRAASDREERARLQQQERELPFVREHVDKQRARGVSARQALPFERLASWEPPPERPDPVGLLVEQDADRVAQLVPIRHYRMSQSPFAFYRGAARIMARDLTLQPHTGVQTQICGDAHLSNFGVFGTPERRLIFDVNDFDETLPGPFEFDLKRLAASLVIAAQSRGFKKRTQRSLASAAARTYREAVAEFARRSPLDVFYAAASLEALETQFPMAKDELEARALTVMSKDSQHALMRLTEYTDDGFRIRNAPPLVVPLIGIFAATEADEVQDRVRRSLAAYVSSLPSDRRRLVRRYRFVDIAAKVVGVGSVGRISLIVLMQAERTGEPLFLQVKEAVPSVFDEYLGSNRLKNQGSRVVAGQRLMQSASDLFLGWSGLEGGRDFYWRQLKDWKGSAEVESMDPDRMELYGRICGWTLARAHARGSEPTCIAGYIGQTADFDDAIADFAVAYAKQNLADYGEYMDAVTSGDITVEPG